MRIFPFNFYKSLINKGFIKAQKNPQSTIFQYFADFLVVFSKCCSYLENLPLAHYQHFSQQLFYKKHKSNHQRLKLTVAFITSQFAEDIF